MDAKPHGPNYNLRITAESQKNRFIPVAGGCCGCHLFIPMVNRVTTTELEDTI